MKAVFKVFLLAIVASACHIKKERENFSKDSNAFQNNLIALKNDPVKKIRIRAALQKIHLLDQQYRTGNILFNKYYSSSDNELIEPIRKSDAENLHYILSLTETYGWLPESIVGADGSETMWLVVQHSNLKIMMQLLPMLLEAVTEGNARKYQSAYLYDRILTMTLRKQLYGTQFYYNACGDPVAYPCIYPTFVNRLRQSMDMDVIENMTPLGQY